MSKEKSIEIPAMYQSLVKPDKVGASRKIVIDVTGTIHAFQNADSKLPPEIQVDREWKNFDDFVTCQEQAILGYHAQYLGAEPPKKQNITTTALYVWAFFIKNCKPHLDGHSVDGTKERKSANASRKYFWGTKAKEPSSLKTPQAITCLRIFTDLIGNNEYVTEDNLRESVHKRQAELRTKQDPWRIFQYYRPQLIKAGLIRHD